jgi:hypothetical protein
MKKTPHPSPKQQSPARQRLEDLLDEALADTFPASDPVAYLVPEAPSEHAPKKKASPQG